MNPLNIIFAGTPEIALPSLQALIDSPHNVIAVYTQPDKPAGRGRKLTASPVKELAQQYDIPVFQPKTLRNAEAQQEFAALQPDLMVVIAYGLILPQVILDIPTHGCINEHVSLLPRWRGAAPIQHAILNGDKQTGVTIMQMDAGLDTGDMLYKISTDISDQDTSQTLHDRLAKLSAEGLQAVLEQIQKDNLKPKAQGNAQATIAGKINKQDGKIDWSKSAVEIDRLVRAYNPWPSAQATLNNQTIKIHKTKVINETSSQQPGAITHLDKHHIHIATGDGILQIEQLQLPGSKRLSATDVLNSKKDLFNIGNQFDA